MQVKIYIAIEHKEHSGFYLDKGGQCDLTENLDKAITFSNMGDASEWFLNSMYAPVAKDFYRYKRIEVTKRVLEDETDEREYEYLRESQISP